MWLIEQKVVLTRDNTLRRNWQGTLIVIFIMPLKPPIHLFFECPIARVTWRFIAICFQQDSRPLSYEQFWRWIPKTLPGGEKFYMFGLAVVYWSI
jgi:hypothetical protein